MYFERFTKLHLARDIHLVVGFSARRFLFGFFSIVSLVVSFFALVRCRAFLHSKATKLHFAKDFQDKFRLIFGDLFSNVNTFVSLYYLVIVIASIQTAPR